jgi:hypothetical protein
MHHSQRAARSFVRGLEIRLKANNCFSIKFIGDYLGKKIHIRHLIVKTASADGRHNRGRYHRMLYSSQAKQER